MVNRRTVVGAGLAFASLAFTAGFIAHGPTVRPRREARSIDALLVDESLEMPLQIAAIIKTSSQALPVVAIQLDAAGQAGLRSVLDKSHVILGISSGATLFCLERIAWDHGFRLTGRSQGRASDPDHECRQDVAAFLSGAHPPTASPSLLARAYRPSRVDGLLHAWLMQKSASPQLRQGRRDV